MYRPPSPSQFFLSEGGVCQRHRLSNNYPFLDLSFLIKKGVCPNTVEGKCPLNRSGLSWGLVIINQQRKIYIKKPAVVQLLESCIQKLSLEGFVCRRSHPLSPPLFSLSIVYIQKQGHIHHFYDGNVFNWAFKSAKRFSAGLTKSMKTRKGDIFLSTTKKKDSIKYVYYIHSLILDSLNL